MDKLLPGNETRLLVPAIEQNGVPYGVGNVMAPYDALTTAILNVWQGITSSVTAGAGAGGNISCAVRDDATLGLTDSNTDDDKTICSTGPAGILTAYKFDSEVNIFRDASLTDTGVFNMATDLVRAPDVPYLDVQRIGKPSTAVFAVGDEIDVYYEWTDFPIPVYGDGARLLTNSKFVAKNIVRIAYTLTA